MRWMRELGEYLDELGHGVEGTDRHGDLLLPAQRERVDDGVQVGLVSAVECRVQVKGAKSGGRQAACAREALGEARRGGVTLQRRDVAE